MWEQNTSQQVDVFLHPQILNNKIHLAFLLITGRWGSLLCALPDRTRTQYVAWKDLYPNNIANLLQTFLKTISSSSGIFWGSWTSVNLFCLRVLEVNKKNRERQHLLSCVLAFKSHWTSSILLLMHTLRYTHDIAFPCGSLINCLIYTFKIQQNTFTHRLQSGLLETKPETRTFMWSVEPQLSGERGGGWSDSENSAPCSGEEVVFIGPDMSFHCENHTAQQLEQVQWLKRRSCTTWMHMPVPSWCIWAHAVQWLEARLLHHQ